MVESKTNPAGLHLLPTLPPESNGLAGYAQKLWQHWPLGSPRWETLSLRIPDGASEALPGIPMHVCRPDAETLQSVLLQLRPEAVILHYVAQAYDANGVPGWLPAGLEGAKAQVGFRLFCIAHETYSSVMPWRRVFLYQAASRRVFAKVMGISDGWATSSQNYFDRAVGVGADPTIGRIVPIGSNVEPVSTPTPSSANERLRIAVFGLPETRERTLNVHRKLLARLSESGRVESLALVGSPPASPESEMSHALSLAPSVVVSATYGATEAGVSQVLLGSNVGLCLNPPDIVTKSGVFAAYCAHGLAPVLPRGQGREAGPFALVDRDSGDLPTELENAESLAEVRIRAFAWASTVGSWDSIAAAIGDGVGAS